MDKLQQKYGNLTVRSDNFNVMVSLKQAAAKNGGAPKLTRENWVQAFRDRLEQYKDDGFDRINPSILKADMQAAYPDFSERSPGLQALFRSAQGAGKGKHPQGGDGRAEHDANQVP